MPKPIEQSSTRHVGAGLTLAVAVGLFAYGGHLLDGVVGSRPLFLITGVMLGGAGGFLHIVKVFAPEMLPRKPGSSDSEESSDDS